jgi:imidazolonepropionase
VFAATREKEFEMRIAGKTYQEIAAAGGGILNSAKHLQNTSFDLLYQSAYERVHNMMRLGTGALEIKSGYGLNLEAEIKMLRVIEKLKKEIDIPIQSTFLAAHALPEAFKTDSEGFVRQVCQEWIPTVAGQKLATFLDVFCEKNYFTVAQTEQMVHTGQSFGLRAKLHVNQFNALGGVAMAVANNAVTVDHLEQLTPADLEALATGNTMAVALPNCSFFLGLPYTPARELLASGIPLALASDYNPGSAPSGNMNLVVALACIKMKMTPEEAINAATINGAYAMGLSDKVGSVTVGKKANLILTKPLASYALLPYAFGENLIDSIFINGNKI